jgi:hypothetical protein
VNNYYLVGAFDRHNYGDILFPAIHKEYILKHDPSANIHYISVTASNMEYCGGFKTISIKELLSRSLTPDDKMVLCGGDILSADWMLMLAHVSSDIFLMPFRIARRLFGIEFSNRLAKLVRGEKNHYPYIISQLDTQAALFYTSVGGAGFSDKNKHHLKKVANLLKGATFISVRDTKIQKQLINEGVNVSCTPDTALIMSDFFSKEKLDSSDWRSTVITHHNFSFEKYYSFQGAKRLIDVHLNVIADEIETVYKATGFAPMMVPIGRAPDHEDHIPLQKLIAQLCARNIPCAIQESEHILSIMASLAHATSYVGTSLHGAITTYSYGAIPCALMSDNVKKLKDFLQTWLDKEDYRLFERPHFADSLVDILKSGGNITNDTKLKDNKALVNQVLEEYVKS